METALQKQTSGESEITSVLSNLILLAWASVLQSLESNASLNGRLLQTNSSEAFVCTEDTLTFDKFEKMMTSDALPGTVNKAQATNDETGIIDSSWGTFIGSNIFVNQQTNTDDGVSMNICNSVVCPDDGCAFDISMHKSFGCKKPVKGESKEINLVERSTTTDGPSKVEQKNYNIKNSGTLSGKLAVNVRKQSDSTVVDLECPAAATNTHRKLEEVERKMSPEEFEADICNACGSGSNQVSIKLDRSQIPDLTLPNRGEWNRCKKAQSEGMEYAEFVKGYYHESRHNSMSMAEISYETNGFSAQNTTNLVIAASFRDHGAGEWKTTDEGLYCIQVDWENESITFETGQFADYTVSIGEKTAIVIYANSDLAASDDDYDYEPFGDINPVYIGSGIFCMFLVLALLGEIKDRQSAANKKIMPNEAPNLDNTDNGKPVSVINDDPNSVKDISQQDKGDLFVQTENKMNDKHEHADSTTEMKISDEISVVDAPETITAFWLQEHAIVGFFMHYKDTLPRAAKIAILFNILFLQLLITAFLDVLPEWYYAGIVAAIIGIAVTPALSLIFTLHSGLSQSIRIFKQVLSAVLTVLIVIATGVIAVMVTSDMSETELNWWMSAFGFAAGLEIILGEQFKIAVKYAIYKNTCSGSAIGKFVRES